MSTQIKNKKKINKTDDTTTEPIQTKEVSTQKGNKNTKDTKDKKEQKEQKDTNKNQVVKTPKTQIEHTDHYLAIIYGGSLKNTDFIIVKDEDGQYSFGTYFDKVKIFYENIYNDKAKKLNATIYYTSNSTDLYNKFIERCDYPGISDADKIIISDVKNINDDILNHIHKVHARSLGHIRTVIEDEVLRVNNLPVKRQISYLSALKPLGEKKPRPKKTPKSGEPQKATGTKNNITDDEQQQQQQPKGKKTKKPIKELQQDDEDETEEIVDGETNDDDEENEENEEDNNEEGDNEDGDEVEDDE